MSEASTDKSIQTDDKSVAETQEKIEVNRSAEEYAVKLREVSAENKKYRQKNAETLKRLEDLEQEKLKESGKWQEAYEKAKNALEETNKKLGATQANFAYRIVSGQVQAKAAELQCVDPAALIDLMSAKGMLEELQVDDAFAVDQSSVKDLMDKAKKQFPYLWGKSAPKVPDANPKAPDAKPTLEKMTLHERAKKLAELNQKR